MPISQMFVGQSGLRPLVLTKYGFTSEVAGATNFSFLSENIGLDVPKLVIVGVNTNDSGSGTNPVITVPTIGGGAASMACQGVGTGRQGSLMFYREMTGGTTADITFTMAGGMGRTRIGIWTLTGYTNPTPFDTAVTEGQLNTLAMTCSVPARGVVLALGASEGAGYTYSGWASKTIHEEDNTVDGATMYSSFYSDTTLAAETDRAFNYTFGGAATRSSACVASWR